VHLFPAADAVRWRLGGGDWASAHAAYPNPPYGASIYYSLKEKAQGELKIEILDAQNRLVRTLSSVAREPDYSSESDDPEDFKKLALSVEPGVQRAVWNLKWEGATKIKNGKIDTGDPSTGPVAVPGAYTVRLTVGGQTVTSPLKIVPDPKGSASQADLEAQLAFALRVRDAISRLTKQVNQVKSVREQLQERIKVLGSRKSERGIGELVTSMEGAVKAASSLEERLHNPTAEVTYDILAMRGGTKLYSRLSPLQMWAVEAEGPPTAGMLQVMKEQEAELAELERATQSWVTTDVAALNQQAEKLGIQFVVTGGQVP
jgi:hypothetical protein